MNTKSLSSADTPAPSDTPQTPRKVLVWDAPVRVLHMSEERIKSREASEQRRVERRAESQTPTPER